MLTISRHDREHTSRARDQQVSSGLHSFKEVWDAHDPRHDREKIIPARDFSARQLLKKPGTLTILRHDREHAC